MTKALFLLVILAGCTLFNKTSSSDELVNLSDDVLKKKEGIEIDVKPIEVKK